MRSVDFAIITGLSEEFKVLKQAIPNLEEVSDERQADIWYRGRIDSERGYGYSIVATFQKDMGPVPATLLTQRLIERWNPAHIILLGIAGSFSRDVRLGDIIVSQQVFYYGPGKAAAGGIQYRPEGYPCSVVLIRQTQALTMDEGAMAPLRKEASASAVEKANAAPKRIDADELQKLRSHQPEIHFGTVASGELVVASEAKQQELLALHGKILGTEMESAGVLHASFFSGDNPTAAIMIKGISDHADHLKTQEDEKKHWRRLATENSIRLGLALIKSGRIKPLRIDEFSVDLTRCSIAEARNRVTRSASPGVSVLGFSKLVLPKGPLTKLVIEIRAFTKAGASLNIIDGVVEYLSMNNEAVVIQVRAGSCAIEIGGVGSAPIGIYLMLNGTAERIQISIESPAQRQEVALVL